VSTIAEAYVGGYVVPKGWRFGCLFALLVLAPANRCTAGNIESESYGRAKLSDLLASKRPKALSLEETEKRGIPFFEIEPYYRGDLYLWRYRGDRKGKDSTPIHIVFDAFRPDAYTGSEPDCPQPHLPELFEFKEEGESGAMGEAAFYCDKLPNLDAILSCKTVTALAKIVPKLVPAYDEDNPGMATWYNWCTRINNGNLRLVFLKATNDAHGNLTRIEVRQGVFRASNQSK
jgi:hypothetical protein